MSQPTSDFDRRYKRALRWGLVLSVLIHGALFVVFSARPLPIAPFAAAGPDRGDFRAAVGGGMEAVELRRPAEAAPTPPAEEPEPDPVEPEPEPEVEPDPVEPEIAPVVVMGSDQRLLVPGAVSALPQPGVAAGAGAGNAGTEADGRERGVPPRPRGLILPPGDRPDRVRGREVEVWVFVNATGRVVADSTRLQPPTGDRRFDRRLREHAAGWQFEAARREGRPVAEWFRYTIIM